MKVGDGGEDDMGWTESEVDDKDTKSFRSGKREGNDIRSRRE